ncbi:MAG: type VII secretion protein EccB, partial [Betaproteobacteria bacterium]
LSVLAARPTAAGETRTAQAVVDWVAVQPGRGAIVDSVAGPNAPGGLLGVVSDLGVLFPVPTTTVLATLGFGGAAPHVLPSALVALLPRGNALDPMAAVVAPA